MHGWPDAAAVTAFLARARRRLAWLAAIRGAAAGLGMAAVAVLLGWIAGARTAIALVPGAIVAVGAIAVAVAIERRRPPAARRVEARAPGFRNVLITAGEIIEHPGRVRDYIGVRVCRDAARAAGSVDVAALFPARRAVLMLAAMMALAAAASIAIVAGVPAPRSASLILVDARRLIRTVEITVEPPGYTGRAAVRLEDPDRVAVLAGSRIEVVVRGGATQGTLETAAGAAALTNAGDGILSGSFVAGQQDGFLAVDARRDDDSERRLIGVTVTPDASPIVRITAPGKDLVVADAAPTLALEVSAQDDLALASLRIVYTKVTGSGENFTFVDGDVPLAIARASETRWTAAAQWPLAPLGLEPGEMVVYRALARDKRPDAPAAESDAFIVEVLAPGSVASEGFAIDDQRDRYAISQQMVILETERLIARRASLSDEALIEQALLIAAEQRQVRAEFVFMMGGHIEDEEVEAAGEHEVAEGRLENRGRVDLVQAIRAMSEAATSLTAADLTTGLAHERQALAALQRAFTRSRYILRTLSERERIDVSRRLTGTLEDAGRDVRETVPASASPRADALGRALAESMALASRGDLGRVHAAAADAIASGLLRADPASEAWRTIAGALTRGAAALRGDDLRAARLAFGEAAAALSLALRAESPAAGPVPDGTARDRLIEGTLAGTIGRGGGR